MESDKKFSILRSYGKTRCDIESVPWSFVEEHEKRAKINHGQDLEKLNERGGLSAFELYALKHDLNLNKAFKVITEESAARWLEKNFEKEEKC